MYIMYIYIYAHYIHEPAQAMPGVDLRDPPGAGEPKRDGARRAEDEEELLCILLLLLLYIYIYIYVYIHNYSISCYVYIYIYIYMYICIYRNTI